MTTERRILEWASDRGILEHGTLTGQTLKLIEEFGEYADAIAYEDKMDAIGDMGVCVVILTRMQGEVIEDIEHGFLPRFKSEEAAVVYFARFVGSLSGNVARGLQFRHQLAAIWGGLKAVCTFHQWSFGEVLESAYEAIAPRQGSMGPNGVWIKQ
jgi:hypothetical protein